MHTPISTVVGSRMWAAAPAYSGCEEERQRGGNWYRVGEGLTVRGMPAQLEGSSERLMERLRSLPEMEWKPYGQSTA